MKNYIVTLIIVLQAVFGFAQSKPSEEILVYFIDGIMPVNITNQGKNLKTAKVKTEKLKTDLQNIGIDEKMLEIAMPDFKIADTLKTMSDSLSIKQLDMSKLYRIKVPKDKSKKEFIKKLQVLPEVLYAEENGTNSPNTIPNDSFYTSQWGLKNAANPGKDIHAEGAWDIYKGNPSNIIAIIDGGVDINHLDLNSKIASADNGFGWAGHGIHVAGIAAASTNNALGIAGVDQQAKILSKRIDNLTDDVATYQAIIDAVNYSPNVHVLNHSWSTTNADQSPGRYSSTVAQAFAYAYKANRVSIAAMGNHQITNTGVVSYPAGFNNVIAVGSTDRNDNIAISSVQGNNIDVTAPGVGIMSTLANNTYNTLSGTSMASPFVAGIASLLKGYKPNLANDDIENIIKLSADKVQGMNNQYFTTTFGFGRVNAERALKLLRDNTLSQFTATGGNIVSTTGNYTTVFMGVSQLAAGSYIVKRHEVTKSVTFPYSFCNLVGAWGRGVGTNGLSLASPNLGEGFCQVVPGTLTNTSATLRTYVYEVYNTIGQSMGFYPTTPANVTFAYTVLGQANNYTISGPASFCTSATYNIPNLPVGSTVTWAAAGTIAISGSANANPVTVIKAPNSPGVGTLNATINSVCGSSVAVPKSINAGLLPLTPSFSSSQVQVNVTSMPGGVNNVGAYNGAVNANVCIPYATTKGISISFGNVQNLQAIAIFGTTLNGTNFGSNISFAFPYTSPNCVIKVEYDIACGHVIQHFVFNNTCYYAPLGTFSVSPNPANSSLKISQETNLPPAQSKVSTPLAQEMEVTKASFEVKLFDDKGNLVLNDINAPDSKDITLNTQNIPNGFYFLHITEGKETVIKQIIIQH